MNNVWISVPPSMVIVLSSADLDKGAESFSEVLAPPRQIVTPTGRVIMMTIINRGNVVPNSCFDLHIQTDFWNAICL
jgi:hypothetical protein